MTIYGVGHSTHTRAVFADLVRGIDILIDVRSHPTSRWEWWRKENIEHWLPECGVDYLWMPELGGWTARHYEWHHAAMAERGVDLAVYSQGAFPKQRIAADIEPDPDRPSWTNQGLYDYAWYMSTEDFRFGIDRLAKYADELQPNVAIMCCEALWWKCHRSMVADALNYRHGIDLQHIKPSRPKRVTTSRVESHVAKIGNRIERYPAEVLEALTVGRSVSAS